MSILEKKDLEKGKRDEADFLGSDCVKKGRSYN